MGNKCIMMMARRPNCRVLSRLALLLTVNIRPSAEPVEPICCPGNAWLLHESSCR
jgi:hypothetical protein